MHLTPAALAPVRGLESMRPPAPAAPVRGDVIGHLRESSVLAELSGRTVWSASSLERWAACPVCWFVERHLHAADLGPDAEPMARGGVAHAVLSEVMSALREQAGSARITGGTLARAVALMREAVKSRVEEDPLSVFPERVPAASRRLEADLSRYLADAAKVASPLEPIHLEIAFGMDEPGGLPPLQLGDGVLLRGRIDRIDVGRSGQAVVYDYKSGRVDPDYSFSKWPVKHLFQMGLYMRAARELLGLEVVGGFYQPLGGSARRPRGILSKEASLDLDAVRTDIVSLEELSEALEDVSAAALDAARQARAGLLEPRPETCMPRGGCSYPEICRCGR